MYFNDFHSQMEPRSAFHGEEAGGAAHLAAAVDIVRGRFPEAVLLFGGDLVQGTPYFNFFRGEPEVDLLNRLEVDAMVLGNHEFDNGVEALAAMLAPAGFPVLSANVILEETRAAPALQEADSPFAAARHLVRTADARDRESLLPPGVRRMAFPYAILETRGVSIGVIGATLEGLPKIVLASVNPGLDTLPLVESLRPWVDALRPEVDLLVLLSHCGSDADSLTALALPEIDVIVGGHDHRPISRPLVVTGDAERRPEGTLIVQAGSRGEFLGLLQLELEEGRVSRHHGELLPVGPRIPAEPEVARLIEGYRTRLASELDDVVAQAPEGLSAEGRFRGDTPLGNLVADVIRESARADLAIQNSGGIRTSLDSGPVTLGETYTILPFENEIYVCRLNGSQVQRLCDFIAATRVTHNVAQVSGVTFEARQGRAVDVRIAGSTLDPARTYRVAVNNFMFHGGDGFPVLGEDSAPEQTGVLLREAFIEAIRMRGYLIPDPEIRIR